MLPAPSIVLLLGLALAFVLVMLARRALRLAPAWHHETAQFVCPELHTPVKCRIEQNVRTGRRARVVACSAFGHPLDVTCDHECVRLLNLGFRLPADGQG